MANTNAQKKPTVYGGQYDQQINELYGQMQNRPDFNYNVNEDALYQQYKDRYTQNAKRSMKDTMGQAAGLTGGYGSTYAQGVGQQAYDETMRGLTDKIPELEERAFSRYQQEGEDILNQFNLANQLGAADQATRQYQQEWDFQQQQYGDQRADAQREWDFRQRQYGDQRADVQREWDFQQRQYADTRSDYGDKQTQLAYENLASAILQSGYQPSADELTASGMTAQQAEALRQAWIGANPGLAYMSGALSAEDYFRLTGQQAPGAVVAGGGGGGGGGRKKTNTGTIKDSDVIAAVQQELNAAGYNIPVTGETSRATEGALASYYNRDNSAYWSTQPHQTTALDSYRSKDSTVAGLVKNVKNAAKRQTK